jgi:uncharacterized membrane protein required for colicin V production
MNIIDVIIILFMLLMGIIGWKNGFIRTIVSAVGIILVFVLSFYLKNPIAEWFSLNLPFFNFWGDFKNVAILNVVIYQLIAFFIVFSILIAIYAVIVRISKFIEKILKMTVILGIPSKILGFIAGLVEGQIIVTIALMFLSLPILGINIVHESKLKTVFLEATPVISNMMGSTSQAVSEIMDLRQEFSSNSTKDKFNEKSLDILLKYNIIEVDYAKKLVNSGKLKMNVNNANIIINKYE